MEPGKTTRKKSDANGIEPALEPSLEPMMSPSMAAPAPLPPPPPMPAPAPPPPPPAPQAAMPAPAPLPQPLAAPMSRPTKPPAAPLAKPPVSTGLPSLPATPRQPLRADGRGQLETEGSYGDFVLQAECITNAEQLNSGIFFRCIPGSAMDGYECQIHNGIKGGDRRKPVDCGTGGIFRRVDARLVVANDTEWFFQTVIADGPHVSTWVNGYQTVDWTDDRKESDNPRQGYRAAKGPLSIQGHDATTDILFRNIRIGELK